MAVTEPEVRAGDVLLFHGRGFVSWAIRKFDGTEVNHAAIALGPDEVGEAGGRGLQTTPLKDAVSGNDFAIVRRFDSEKLDDVVTVASTYLDAGRPYAYQQIVLLALLASTRKIPMPKIGRRFLRSALDHAASALNAFLDQGGTKSMICSEYVYRCYEEAPGGPPPPFHLKVILGDAAFSGGAGGVDSAVGWALGLPDDAIPPPAPPSFAAGAAPLDPATADDRAELDLAPLIAAYAAETGLADDDMPTDPVAVPFSTDVAEDVTDEELLQSMVGFGVALGDQGIVPAQDFSGAAAALGGAAAKAAIAGILKVSVDANFVTPGDLLRSPSLSDIGRFPST
jgi:hypothetical protein